MMKRFNVLAGLAAVVLCAATASTRVQGQAAPSAMETARAELPWAFHVSLPGLQREDDGAVKTVPGSDKSFTVPEINDPFAPPDWYPDEHPPMPDIVATGRSPEVRACSQCHLPNGLGHPESSSLAALPAAYIKQQMEDFRTLDRKNGGIMTVVARGMTDAELDASSEYFASLPLTPWTTVVETDQVPTTYVGPGNMRFEVTDPVGTEPLGQRIIVVPEDHILAELRDSHSGFVAYVPVGSIAAGERLATTGGDKTIRCGVCHGADLKGQGPIPGFAGRSAIYIVRQLYSFQHGLREGPWSELMAEAVANLTTEDLIALSAYAASLEP